MQTFALFISFLIKKNVQQKSVIFITLPVQSLNTDNGKKQPDEGKLTEKAASYSAAIPVHI